MAKTQEQVSVTDRTLPHDLAAERGVLGTILLDATALTEVGDLLSETEFYRQAHRLIFRTMVSLDTVGTTVDFLTLKAALSQQGILDECGGPAYLAGLTEGMPRRANVRHYAGIVRRQAKLREIVAAANSTLAAAYEAEEEPRAILDEADHAFLQIRAGAQGHVLESSASLAKRAIGPVDRTKPQGIPTGLTDLDQILGGWQPGSLNVIAAGTSIGKTALVLGCARHAAELGFRTVGFSLEMTADEVFERLLLAETHLERARLQQHWLTEQHWDRLTTAMTKIAALPFEVNDASAVSVAEMRAQAKRRLYGEPLGLVWVDYIQLALPHKSNRKDTSREQEVAMIGAGLKGLAKELRVPLLALSQLNEKEDTRESKALEHAADVVIIIKRQTHAGKPESAHVAELVVRKHRHGPTGTARVSWVGRYASFANLAREESTV